MSRWIAVPMTALVLTAGCGAAGQPVPVLGDTRVLAGEWEGEYRSEATGRYGSILFRLAAGADSAYGDVLMVPQGGTDPLPAPHPDASSHRRLALPRALTIAFVACDEGEISGKLNPYTDPDTGEAVETVFLGKIRGNRLDGTFTTYYRSGARATGHWWVERKTAP